MPRRHAPPESVHAQRWMVSYADFMTLMFAFFVVLYASSSLNDEKFKQMSDVFIGVFDQPAALSLPQDFQTLMSQLSDSLREPEDKVDEILNLDKNEERLHNSLQALIDQSINKPRVSLNKVREFLQLEIPSDYIFNGKNDVVSVEGEYILSQLADVFEGIPNFISIEVFTDDQVDQTNPWQLASSQGMAILQLLALDDVSPLRLAAVNYGPFQPIATNDDEDGQSINRRVLFLIHSTSESVNRIKTVTDAHLSANP
ncbi:flagellar motor protein MotB [Bermanella sp. WJH001]|uniref:flagellar motor protein MotB n=1 Tax=Bermanella sp. WJH001 TaxID=3048005 RepID=UPI0024BE9236|nr:flagellar motor protein MotB [Bermanella sp. WJH001]MDJ1539845.1 flagellar motor protein MotB [Bermanella sp. WJH001]